jgi:hypothetical protein
MMTEQTFERIPEYFLFHFVSFLFRYHRKPMVASVLLTDNIE